MPTGRTSDVDPKREQTMGSQASDSGIPPAAVGHGALNLPEGIGADDADRRAEEYIDESRPVLAADPDDAAMGSEPAESRRASGDQAAD
jgi:hypothetical protein